MKNLLALAISLMLATDAAYAEPVKVALHLGQSNQMAYAERLQLGPDIPGWAQTTANGWEGHRTQSTDTGTSFDKPTLANFPCRYVEYYGQPLADAWGNYLGQTPLASGTIERGACGPEVAFHWLYKQQHPTDEVAVIKVALGGTSIEEWLPASSGLVPADGPMWTVLVQEVSRAKARFAAESVAYEFSGLVWIHGENGCSTVWPYLNSPNDFLVKTRAFFAAVRTLTETPELPIVVSRIGEQMLAPAVIGTHSSGIDTPENRIAATNHRRGLQITLGNDPHCALSSQDGLTVRQQGTNPAYWLHWSNGSVLAHGERNYVAWQQAAGETPPPPPPPLLLNVTRNAVAETVTGGTVKLNGVPVGGPGDVIEVEYEVSP